MGWDPINWKNVIGKNTKQKETVMQRICKLRQCDMQHYKCISGDLLGTIANADKR